MTYKLSITNTVLEWYLNRIDGPDVECPDGSKYWFLNNTIYSKEEYLEKVKEYEKSR